MIPSTACMIPIVRDSPEYMPLGHGVRHPSDQPIMEFKELVPDTERYKEWLAWVKPEQWVQK